MIILLIFSITSDLKMFIYLIFLNLFISVNLQMESFLHTVKNQALIANCSMRGQKGCFIRCLSVIMVTIYSEGNLFVEGLLFQFYSIINASSQLKPFSYPKYLGLFEHVATFQFTIYSPFQSYEDFAIFVCSSIYAVAPVNRFQHRHFDIFADISSHIFLTYSLVYITEPVFFHS